MKLLWLQWSHFTISSDLHWLDHLLPERKACYCYLQLTIYYFESAMTASLLSRAGLLPGEFVEHVDQFHGFRFFLFISHSLHRVGLLLLHTAGHWIDAVQHKKHVFPNLVMAFMVSDYDYVYMRTDNAIISNNQSKDLIALWCLHLHMLRCSISSLPFTCIPLLFAKNCG